MRKIIIVLLVMVTGLTHAQIMLPSYQAAQYRGPSVPVLTTTAASTITGAGAASGGNITLQGASAVTARGVCWSTLVNPVVGSGNQTSDGTGIGTFTSNITGLELSTNYYLRAYATNGAGTGYGNQATFTTAATLVSNIGDSRDGGTVTYILKSGDTGYNANTQHGLIAFVFTGMYVWRTNNDTDVNGTSTLIGTGLANTTAIYNVVGTSEASYAARVCYDLVLGGKDDWYLPSRDELIAINPNISYLPNSSQGNFWSSSVSSSGISFVTVMGPGVSGRLSQGATASVIAVRSF